MNKEKEIEDAGLVSAIWILSCVDPIPTMTFEYIKLRLGFTNENPIKPLLEKHKELFSTSISLNWLNLWKRDMLKGKLLPSRITSLPESEREAKIDSIIDENKVFRSQFRLTYNADISPIEITKWGLEHIEKARKAKDEVKDDKKRWWKDFMIPMITILISAIISLGSVYFINSFNTENKKIDERLKNEEINFQREKMEKEIQLKEKEIEILKEKSNSERTTK